MNVLICNKRYTWKHLFHKAITKQDFNQPITYETLKDPASEIVCALLWIYSMESFVYKQLNAATRDHDPSYVDTLGPMCQALGTIVEVTEHSRQSDPSSVSKVGKFNLYRGISLPNEVV